MIGWLFGRKRQEDRKPILAQRQPADAERLGPAPPPERTPQSPGVRVHRFGDTASAASTSSTASTLLAEASGARRSRTLVPHIVSGGGHTIPPAKGERLGAFVLLGEGTSGGLFLRTGDLLTAPLDRPVEIANPGPGALRLLVDVARGGPGAPPARIGREELPGRSFPGITGIRALSTDAALLCLRMGPPPGARWVLVGLRSLAVLAGKFVIVDGEVSEPQEVLSGEIAVVSDPSATLYLQAGNDSATAAGFADPGLVVALG